MNVTQRENELMEVLSLVMDNAVDRKRILHDLATLHPHVFLSIFYRHDEQFVSTSYLDEQRQQDRLVTSTLIHPYEGEFSLNPRVPNEEEDLPLYAQFVMPIIRSGRLIEAIKQFRNLTGAGLKEAKDYCTKLRDYFAPSLNNNR